MPIQKLDVLNRFSGAVQFTAEIECAADATPRVKLGLAVRWAIKSGVNLSRANLSGAYLSGVNLSRADLSGAYLSRADLSGANLSGAYLSGVNLSRADLSGAYLSGANLGNQWIVQGATRSDGYAFLLTSHTGEGVRVKAGCRNFTIEEAHEHWSKTRDVPRLNKEAREILESMIRLAKIRGYKI